MTDRELRKLSRAGLLEILLTQSREIDRLRAEVEELNARLEDRDLIMSHSGSIAEASPDHESLGLHRRSVAQNQ